MVRIRPHRVGGSLALACRGELALQRLAISHERGQCDLALANDALERLAPREQVGSPAAGADQRPFKLVCALSSVLPCLPRRPMCRSGDLAVPAGLRDAQLARLVPAIRLVSGLRLPRDAPAFQRAELGEGRCQPGYVGVQSFEIPSDPVRLTGQPSSLGVRCFGVTQQRGAAPLSSRGGRDRSRGGIGRVRVVRLELNQLLAHLSASRHLPRRRTASWIRTTAQCHEAPSVGQVTLRGHGRPTGRQAPPPREQRPEVGRDRDAREDAGGLVAANPFRERPTSTHRRQCPVALLGVWWSSAVEEAHGAAGIRGG